MGIEGVPPAQSGKAIRDTTDPENEGVRIQREIDELRKEIERVSQEEVQFSQLRARAMEKWKASMHTETTLGFSYAASDKDLLHEADEFGEKVVESIEMTMKIRKKLIEKLGEIDEWMRNHS
ncbi:MAG: hypothetical protein Q8L30_01055 [bacterium]|nr:hypothetical protein [bacterium]